MAALVQELERRDTPRLRRQLACLLLVDGLCHRGVVREFSARGLVVETLAALPPEAAAIVAFRTPEGERIALEASVPRRSPVARSLAHLVSAGVALHIEEPPPAYLRWIDRSLESATA